MSDKSSRNSLSPVSDQSEPADADPEIDLAAKVSSLKRPASGPVSSTEESVDEFQKKSRPSFSIQSILARPEPLRPMEHPMPYAQILQANFAHCFSHKFSGPTVFYPWMMAMPPPHHEVPGMDSNFYDLLSVLWT